jgi:hypothetical protein
VTQPNAAQPTAELISRTLNSLRTAYENLAELTDTEGGINALVHTSHGTALLHDLRWEIDRLHKLLPFKS